MNEVKTLTFVNKMEFVLKHFKCVYKSFKKIDHFLSTQVYNMG